MKLILTLTRSTCTTKTIALTSIVANTAQYTVHNMKHSMKAVPDNQKMHILLARSFQFLQMFSLWVTTGHTYGSNSSFACIVNRQTMDEIRFFFLIAVDAI